MYSAGADIVFNNLELCVQIESGSEYTEFEQFVPNMPSPDYPSEIKCCGDGNVFDLYKFIEDANNSSYYEKNNENLVINKTDTRNEGFTYYLNLIVGGRYKITATNLVSIRAYEEGNVTPIININDVTSCEFIATSKKMAVKFISSNTLPYTVGKVEIFGVINVNICNKNKFNKNTVFSGKYIGANGGIQSQEGISYSDYIYVEPNISYYFGDRGTWVSVAQYDKNKTFISRITIPIGTYQFTEDVKFIRCNIDNTYLDTFQLEEGETGTEYVEHKGQIYTIPTQKEMLEDDYFDWENEEEVHTWEKIESYNGEEVSTEYKSTTGELTTGATIYYKLEKELRLPFTEEQKTIAKQIQEEAQTYKNITHTYSTYEVGPNFDLEYYTDTQMNETFAKTEDVETLKEDVKHFKATTVNVAQFGAVGDGLTDDTKAIQNAITSAGFGGTVEFEKGKDYLVSSTIFVGIGQTLNFNYSNITPSATGAFTNNFVFSVNSSDVETWDNAYSSRTTIINKLKADNINLVENLKLMYAPCSLQVNWLFSRRFYGTIDSGNYYTDMYELNDIYIYDNFGDNYAIYKRGQGDAFIVNKMLTLTFLDDANMNAVSLGSTAGCQLNNVIGGNYLFYNSRSVSINNAHIEIGRITIKNSQVVINNSYLWKDGNNSTIEITDNSISSSKDINLPVVLNNVIFKVRNIKYDYTTDFGDIDITNFNGLLELNNVMRVNEINSNNYYYEAITGISIKTGTDSFVYTVDNITHIRNKIIEPIRKIFTTLATGYYTLTSCSAFESDKAWQATADKEYFYKVLVLNDTKRMCGINESNVTSACVKSAIPSSTQNVLLNLGKVAGMSLRILRGSSLTTFEEYVDIPFCQSRVLVDTGSCVNGFEWKTNSSGTYPTINNISSEDFVTNFDGNVCCYGKEKPSVGTWKAGDRVYDITGATNGWRCTEAGTSGTWVEM